MSVTLRGGQPGKRGGAVLWRGWLPTQHGRRDGWNLPRRRTHGSIGTASTSRSTHGWCGNSYREPLRLTNICYQFGRSIASLILVAAGRSHRPALCSRPALPRHLAASVSSSASGRWPPRDSLQLGQGGQREAQTLLLPRLV